MSSQTPDDDHTVIRTGLSSAPVGATPQRDATPPTASSSAGDSGNALPIGTYVGEFELTSVLGEGGFGIVYLAWDHSLERRVALKEYMPSALSARVGNTQVQVKSARHKDTFEAGLRSFVNEAKLLASFDHPSLVKVYRFWEANGTAYMVMPFYEGITLKDKLREMGAAPDEQWLMALLAPLTEALEVIHCASCFHRDIAPDNVILLGASQKPLLLDFGAARRVIGDMTQALTVILKPGYAPVEQYAEAPNMKQGAWTDVYALAASMHFAIMGRTPPPSVGRLMSDSYVPLEQSAGGRYSPGFLQAIDRALRVRPEDRTASIADLRADLGLGDSVKSEGLASQSIFDAPTQFGGQSAGPVVRAPTQPAVLRASPAGARSGAGKGLWVGLGGLLLAAAAGGGAYMLMRPNEAAVVAPSAKESAIVPAPATVAVPTPDVAVAVATVFDPREEFNQIVQSQTSGFTVEAKSAKQQFRIGKDRLAFNVTSVRDGFVNVLVLEQDGSLLLLFPNAKVPNNRIKAGQNLTLPPRSWPMDTSEPPGPQQFLVIVSAQPRDYSSLSKEQADVFLKLPTGDKAAAIIDALKAKGQPASALLLGNSTNCTTSNCDDFGAAQFGVDIVR